ncbi:hypothetical protein MYU51_016473 [Penicillium brevicompactum]
MARRTHKKSRNGCIECKRRHMKCDEKRPICSNCVSSQRHCEFAEPYSFVEGSRSASREATTASPSTVSTPGALPPRSVPEPVISPEDAAVNMLHVEFVHNLCSERMNIFNSVDAAPATVSFPDILHHGLNAPYLMNELLSLSALHLSIVKPEKQKFYQHHSTQLQNYALSSFNALSSHITDENTIPIFLFAGSLGLHKLCETLVFRDDNFENFLDRFVQYVILHYGVRTVAGQGRWHLLQQSSLKPILELGERIPALDSTLGPVCQGLLDRIRGLDLDDSIFKVYTQAVQAVQSMMTLVEERAPGKHSLDVLAAWSVLLPREYIDLLAERRCEALVIFAYYGALVDTHNHLWIFGDGGEYVVTSISQYLGAQWEEWLQWPLQNLTGKAHVHV